MHVYFQVVWYTILITNGFQVCLFNKISFNNLCSLILFKQSVMWGLVIIRGNFCLIGVRYTSYAMLYWYCNAYVDVSSKHLKFNLNLNIALYDRDTKSQIFTAPVGFKHWSASWRGDNILQPTLRCMADWWKRGLINEVRISEIDSLKHFSYFFSRKGDAKRIFF